MIVFSVISITALLGLPPVGEALAGVVLQDINPNSSDLDPSDPDGSSGGRVNGLASVAGSNQIFYAATEWGGLYKTTDGGVNWARLDRHLPVATWDVEVDPASTNTVYATSFYDGRVNSLAGINVSYDGGNTWTHPATATPPLAYNCANTSKTERAAYGIGIRPDASNNVFIGTNCGVAISTDSGVTWTFVDPTPTDPAGNVWDVVVQSGGPSGIVDICGDDGHFRSTDGGTTWIAGTGLPGGLCSIAASPDESYVLFVTVGTRIFESDDAGATWPTEFTNPLSQGRIPFVVTNQRSDSGGVNRFDLWFGDVSLYRAGCTTPASPALGGAARCPASSSWAGGFTRGGLGAGTGAHDDTGDLVFNRTVSVDACPMILSSDGGVYRNTDTGSDCQNPDWDQPSTTPHATWLFGMGGADRAGDAPEDLYFGLQDDGSWATTNAGAATPTWSNKDCCDVFDVVADSNRVLYSLCCFSPGRATRLFMRNPGMTGGGEINTYPAGNLRGFRPIDGIDRFGDKEYVLITTSGVFITTDITASPIVWTQIGASNTPASACGVKAADTAGSPGTPTFYVQAGTCNERNMGNSGDQLLVYTGTAPGGTWQRVDNNGGQSGGIGVFTVDPTNSNRLYASNMRTPVNGGPRMVFSNDGGTTWINDPKLDNKMTGNGVFKYRTEQGPSNFTGFVGYPQPTLVGFDPGDANILVAGGRDSGVFVSTNGGGDWGLITDPFDSGNSGVAHLPRPWFAYFDHEPAGTTNLYLGTQGRGVWRAKIRIPTANAGGPYVTNEGTDVTLNASASSDPDGQPLTYEWDLDNDGNFNDATGPTPTFDRVGQDGVFTVRVKVSAGGVFAIATTTVTVNNVAPSVTLGSNAPKNENSTVAVSGLVSDPGWLDPLTATVNWGDGTPVQPIAGTLENIRPDATLTFNISHTYGDNGNFSAQVCGSDDDTTTCQSIALQIDNVNPTAVIDTSSTVLINGVPTFLAHAGGPINFSGRSQDPGSDDLFLSWDWDDGLPSPDVTTTYLVNPPNPDPFPSPSIQPRDVTDTKTHAFGQACQYKISFLSADDDLGTGQHMVDVLITGNATRARSVGYWMVTYGGTGSATFDTTTLNCYLEIVGFVSQVFNEVRDASTIPNAYNVLFPGENYGSTREQFDRILLAVWLNFANGAFNYLEPLDSNGDGVPDTTFAGVMAAAEAVRLNPSVTDDQLKNQMQTMKKVKLMMD